MFIVPKSFPPSKHPQNFNCFCSVDTNFEGCMIGIVGNHLLAKIILSDNVQKNSNARAPRSVVRYFQRKYNNIIKMYGNEPSSQKYQKRFNNTSYRSDTVTVNYTRSFTQQLLHTIVNNKNVSRK